LEEAIWMGHWEWGRILHHLTLNDLLSLHDGPRSPGGSLLFAHPIPVRYKYRYGAVQHSTLLCGQYRYSTRYCYRRYVVPVPGWEDRR
jgi:hypothetical protein